MSDTPRTDALLDDARAYLRSNTSQGAYLAQLNILADHSRQLERENAALHEALHNIVATSPCIAHKSRKRRVVIEAFDADYNAAARLVGFPAFE